MKPKYIVGIVAAIALTLTAVLAVEDAKIEYMDFNRAAESGRTAQVSGAWVKDDGYTYDPEANHFRFTMQDESGTVMPVTLVGAKPNNFELATSVVATGRVDGQTFHATKILTKCPSKYEAEAPGAASAGTSEAPKEY